MPDSAQILVPSIVRVYLAPVGTTAPADASAALDAAWRDVGYTTEDSVAWSTDPSFAEVRSHQSNLPTRRVQTADAAMFAADLQQWSAANFTAVYGGGTATQISAGQYKWTPPAIGARTSVACLSEVVDGTKRYRLVIPKCFQVEGVEINLNKTAESVLALRLAVEGSDVGDPWYVLSNDQAMAPAA